VGRSSLHLHRSTLLQHCFGLACLDPHPARCTKFGVAILLPALRRAPSLTLALGEVFAKTILTDVNYVAHGAPLVEIVSTTSGTWLSIMPTTIPHPEQKVKRKIM
jgi:hypothetical protein